MSTFTDFQKTQGKWATKTFGDQTADEKLLHLKKEVDELIENPGNVEEFADVLSLVVDVARLQGFTVDYLIAACWDKLGKNRQRTWTRNSDGTYSGSKI